MLEELDALEAVESHVLVQAIEAAMSAVLSIDSTLYQKIVSAVEATIQDQ